MKFFIKKGFNKLRKEKKGIELEILAWYLIAIAVLVLAVASYFVLKAKGIDALEYIQNLFRFRK